MPEVTLVVCLHNERDELQRLLQHSSGCYDDLVVGHDGPDEGGVRSVVEAAGGHFFEGPRAFQQEPHWPFAFERARCDWILRLDADEFPSGAMRLWLQEFRRAPEPAAGISGYTCIWPLWDGKKALSDKYFNGRLFLFDRRQARFFGMVEQTVIPDGQFKPLDLILHHQPKRRAYGVRHILLRKQCYRWRKVIAQSLLGKPTDLPCWRWDSEVWPEGWEQIRRRPLRTGMSRLIRWTVRGLRDQWKLDRRFFPTAALTAPLHHLMIGLTYWRLQRKSRSKPKQA